MTPISLCSPTPARLLHLLVMQERVTCLRATTFSLSEELSAATHCLRESVLISGEAHYIFTWF
jgi:hypothetical protein